MSKPNVYKRILVISDLHTPYSHPDVVRYLRALNKKYKFDKIVCIGDEIDYHALSFHDSDPDLPSAGLELEAAIKALVPIYKMFPHVDVVESNHGSMVLRKALANGMPKRVIRNYNETLDAPAGWKWFDDLIIQTPLGPVYFHHSRGAALKTSQLYGMSHVCGHMHEQFNVSYWSTPAKLLFGMTVGCLIDRKSFAFAYNKTNLKRPIIGSGVIINGIPMLEPMVLDKAGRWIGHL